MRLLSGLLILMLVLSLGVQVYAQSDAEFDGVWVESEYGLVIVIEAGTLTVMLPGDCTPVAEYEVQGDTVFDEGQEDSTLTLEDDNLILIEDGVPTMNAVRAESLEVACVPPAEIEISVASVASWDEWDTLVADVFAQTDLPGMAVAVVTPAGVAWSQGYGWANVEAELPATADTPFALASITKTVTGTALMIAHEEGALGLDDPVNDWLPFVVDNPLVEGDEITLRHLATHTSGILDYEPVYNGLYAPGDPTIPLGDFLQGYLAEGGEWYSAEDNFAPRLPGETWEYSNVGAALAGYILELATGTPLDAYAQDHLFDPLGMTETGWKLAAFADSSVIAVPYGANGQALEHYGYPTWPDGMLRASVNDLGTFLAMIMNGGELGGVRVISAEGVDRMLQPQLETAPMQGWFWDLGSDLPGLIGHTGGDPGVRTFMVFSPETDLGVITLINSSSPDAIQAMLALVSAVYEYAPALVAP